MEEGSKVLPRQNSENNTWLLLLLWAYLAAHRIAWMITYGPIPKGKCVLHKCDNSICVNPNHLHLGTAKDNMREKVRRGRQYKKISDKAVRQIRTLANQGRSRKEIAGKFGISKSHVGNIVRRKSRRYLKRN